MLTIVSCLSDVHLQLMTTLEEILWISSPEDPRVSTKVHTRQGTPSPFSIGHLNTMAGQPHTCWMCQGKEQEYIFPLPQPQVRVIGSHRRWSRIMGVTSAEICVSDGQVFAASSPGLLRALDLAQVALAVETGRARLSDELSPLVKPYRDALCVQNSEELWVFPYLQLTPPHCFTCRC